MSDEGLLWQCIRMVVLLLLGAFLVAGGFTRTPHDDLLSVVGGIVALGGAAAAWLGRGGVGKLLLLLVATAGVVLAAGAQGNCVAWFGLCAVSFEAKLVAPRRLGVAFALVPVGVLVERMVATGNGVGWLPWLGGVLVSGAGGLALARDRELLRQLRAAQVDLAERSRVQERARIARDLHDVIAHTLTVSLLHISAARLAVENEPGEAARSLAEAERLGRESLDEVRSIVGLMRSDGGGQGLAPVPAVDRIEELVAGFRDAGAEVRLELGSGCERVPATVGTTAYRITQEALTNAAKHAPGMPVSVVLDAREDRLELAVESGGSPGSGEGHGLLTMRERAEAVGGSLSAGPGGPGWRVHASLPLRANGRGRS